MLHSGTSPANNRSDAGTFTLRVTGESSAPQRSPSAAPPGASSAIRCAMQAAAHGRAPGARFPGSVL